MKSLSAIILGAGMGKRMKSDLPKVVHPVAGAPMVRWVADACAEAGCGRIVVVVGHQHERVRAVFAGADAASPRGSFARSPAIEFVLQQPQLGTGHAVLCAKPLFEREVSEPGHGIFVLAGDGPLIRAATLARMLERHRASNAVATIATSVIPDPTGYGRIIRDDRGRFRAIVEDRNCTEPQRLIREVNPSYYCFDARALFEALTCVQRNEVSGEYYLTDVLEVLLRAGRTVEVIDAVPPEDVLSINTPEQLAEVDRILRARLARSHSAPRALGGAA